MRFLRSLRSVEMDVFLVCQQSETAFAVFFYNFIEFCLLLNFVIVASSSSSIIDKFITVSFGMSTMAFVFSVIRAIGSRSSFIDLVWSVNFPNTLSDPIPSKYSPFFISLFATETVSATWPWSGAIVGSFSKTAL